MACGVDPRGWETECQRQLEAYRKYVELARFRSEKCRLPGPSCGYAEADLQLMRQYIENATPLCGKLIKSLAVMEEKFRALGVEGLKNGYRVGVTRPDGELRPDHEIVTLYHKKPVYATAVLWKKRLYVFYDRVRLRGKGLKELARKAVQAGASVETYEVDDEYKRLWFEVPLPKPVSRLLGGRDWAPIVLFRNLGWLLSDDARKTLKHGAGNPGQVAVRLFDWIALAEYAIEKGIAPKAPLVFELAIRKVTKTEEGDNPTVEAVPVGEAAEVLNATYDWFGIALGKTEEVLAKGYAILKALREEAFRRDGKMYVVNNVGAWIAFSNAVDVLVVGDGYVLPYEIRIAVKTAPRATLAGKTSLLEELADAIGGTTAGDYVRLQTWHMRLLLPTPPTPAFDKTAKLFETLANYPAAAVVEVNGSTYLLAHNGGGEFVIGKGIAAALHEAVERLGIKTRFKRNLLLLTYAQLEELARRGFAVKLLNDAEKDAVREVRPAISLDVIRHMLEEVAKAAEVAVVKEGGRECIKIRPPDKSKAEEIATMLRAVGIKARALRQEVKICERRSIEKIRKVSPHFFPPIYTPLHRAILPSYYQIIFTLPFTKN